MLDKTQLDVPPRLYSGVAASALAMLRAKAGAGSRIRTDDLLITNQLLYQLSYAGEGRLKVYKRYNVKTEGPESHRNFCNPAISWTPLSAYSRTRE